MRRIAWTALVAGALFWFGAGSTGCGDAGFVCDIAFAEQTFPDGVVGRAYEYRVKTLCRSGTEWKIFHGALPPGLSLDGVSGVVAGTPTEAGSFPFTLYVTADNRGGGYGREEFTIVVAEAGAL
jgi:hypothetical protein